MYAMHPDDSRSALPQVRTLLVGRERELASVRDLLGQADVPLVTLTGPGGVGKTRLALAVAAEAAATFPDGVAFVGLAALAETALLLPTIARALGLREGGVDLVERIATLLGARTVLLVLDNLEHLIEAGPRLAELLIACPRLTILATSRVVLRLSGEQVFPVPPLALPDHTRPLDPDGPTQPAAISLFVQRAHAADPAFVLTADNAPVVAEIVRRLDGLPLAIELAASRLRALSPTALLVHLSDRLHLLTGGARDLPARQRTMRDTIAWSYELLDPDEQVLFRRLSVFAGGFMLEAAEAVFGSRESEPDLSPESSVLSPLPSAFVLNGLASLVDQSLVHKTEQPDGVPHYAMLETVREFGSERLAGSGETAATNRRLAEWALAFAREADPGLRGPDQRRWPDRLAAEHANLRAALGWLAETGDAETGAELAAALFEFWLVGGCPAEGRGWLDRFLASCFPPEPATRAAALWATGMLASIQGDFSRAQVVAEESLALARRIERPLVLAGALNLLALARGMAHQVAHPGDFAGERALVGSLHAEALELYRAHGELYWTAWVLANSADYQDDPDQQEARWQESLSLFRAVGYATGAAVALGNLGERAGGRGAWALAAPAFGEALALCWRDGDRWTLPCCVESLGRVALLGLGQAERAVRLFGAASAMRAATGFPPQTHEESDLARDLGAAKARLGSTAFAAAWEAGRMLPTEEAVTEALGVPVAVPRASESVPHGLTPRELAVLRLLAEGRSDRAIAKALFVTPYTASTHVRHILAKLGAASRTEAAAQAFRYGLVDPAPPEH